MKQLQAEHLPLLRLVWLLVVLPSHQVRVAQAMALVKALHHLLTLKPYGL
jgi:hypothetical protein